MSNMFQTRTHAGGRLQLAAIRAAASCFTNGSAQSSKRLSLERSMIIWTNSRTITVAARTLEKRFEYLDPRGQTGGDSGALKEAGSISKMR